MLRGPFSDIRWVPCYNNYAGSVPAFGLVQITGADSNAIPSVTQPNADGQQVAIAGATDIAQYGYGVFTLDSGPCYALYETGDGTPAPGDTWGAGAGSFKLRKGKSGFTIVGNPTGGRVVVVRNPAAVSVIPQCSVYCLNALTVGSGSAVSMTFTQPDYDSGGFFGGGSPTFITIPVTGYYEVGIYATWDFASWPGAGTFYLGMNGNQFGTAYYGAAPTWWQFGLQEVKIRPTYFFAGTQIGFTVAQDTGHTVNTAPRNHVRGTTPGCGGWVRLQT